jgi:hypothetical protein
MSRHVALVVGTMNFAIIQEEFTETDQTLRQNYACPADPAPNVSESTCLNEEYHWVRYALRHLSRKEQEVLAGEFGFDGSPVKNRLSRRGVRREKLYLSALAELRRMAEAADVRSA